MAWGGLIFLGMLPILALGYRREAGVAEALRVGFWGGLLGTLGYDLVRIPFHLNGFLVFAPIETYGVWLLEAQRSSGLTDALGWLYHFSNGITFGWMYALTMRERSRWWGVLWGLSLETIVVASPFVRIFHLAGQSLVIAYGAHLAYGYPLGLAVQHWSSTLSWMSRMKSTVVWTSLLILGFCLSPLKQGLSLVGSGWLVQGRNLAPRWLRLPGPGEVVVENPGPETVRIHDRTRELTVEARAGSQARLQYDRPGIYQVWVETGQRTRSSFVIIEPVEEQP